MRRLKLFCSHDYTPWGTNLGENLLGDVTYAVEFKCLRCLKIKRELGYGSRRSAQIALANYRDMEAMKR